jgi:peroxiredoxin
LALASTSGAQLDVANLASGLLALVLLTGNELSVQAGNRDTVLCRGYRERLAELAQLGVTVAGLCSRELELLCSFAEREGVSFALLSDPGMMLGRALALPRHDGGYRRMALLIRKGRVERIFGSDQDHGAGAADLLDSVSYGC